MKTSIVYSQSFRMKRICFRRSNLIVDINKLKDWFRERAYTEEIVNKETKQALESSIDSSNNISKMITQDDRQTEIPLVVTYNPFLCHLGQTTRKNIFLLYEDSCSIRGEGGRGGRGVNISKPGFLLIFKV